MHQSMHPNIAVNTHKPTKMTIAFPHTSRPVCLLKSTASGHFKSGAAFFAFCTCFSTQPMHFFIHHNMPPPSLFVFVSSSLTYSPLPPDDVPSKLLGEIIVGKEDLRRNKILVVDGGVNVRPFLSPPPPRVAVNRTMSCRLRLPLCFDDSDGWRTPRARAALVM